MRKNISLIPLTGLLACTPPAAELPALAAGDRTPSLPFAIRITETVEMPELKHLYYSDYPSGLTVIEGDLWFIGKNGDGPPVNRKKGRNIEELKNLPGGSAGAGSGSQPRGSVMEDPVKGRCHRPYILGGIWYDPAEKRIYAPLHCEYFWNKWPIQRQIHLASSGDLGLTWTYEGPIFLYADPQRAGSSAPLEARGAECSGGLFISAGDYHLFTDEKTGYHYLFSNHYLRKKPGAAYPGMSSRHQVVRCAIADKMAPGKWLKFHNGKWDQAGVGGKGSYVSGYCVTYNTYLKKYLSFDWGGGVAACDDIEKQDWTPIFRMPGASWGLGDERRHLAWYVAGEEKTDGNRTGRIFYVYTGFPIGAKGASAPRRLKIELGPGETHPTQGFICSGLAGWEASGGPSANPDLAYPVAAFADSPDPIESRRTVAPQPGEVTYHGEWKAGASDKPGSAVRCTFKAREIYYRNSAGPDCGKADVYLDGLRMKTLDCWSAGSHNKQFGFVKSGLDPAKHHVLEIRVRGDRHPLSTGTAVRAGTFEYSADCYRASDGFSSVQGKNQWRYTWKKDGQYVELTYADPMTWTGEGPCAIGINWQTPGASEAARTWTAPHDGVVRLQGHVGGRDSVGWDPLIVYVDDETKSEAAKAAAPAKPDPKATVEARILKNGEALWTARVGNSAHDLRVAVKTGDVIAFATKLLAADGRPEK